MPAGMQVVNDSGIIQIDQDYSNHLLVSKGRGVTVAGNSMASFTVPYNGNGNAPIICFKPVDTWAFVLSGPKRNQAGQWVIAADGVGKTVDWYVFDTNVTAQDTGPGLSVYNGSGRLVYNSNQQALKVKQQVVVPVQTDTLDYSTWVGGDYAICASVVKALINETGAPYAQFLAEGARMSGGVFSTAKVSYGLIPWNGPSQPINMTASTFTLVDVSGI